MSFETIINNNKNKFLKYNKAKLTQFENLFFNENIKNVVNSIPLLLSINHKSLPGYVSGDVQIGIVNYTPEDETINYITKKFHLHKFNFQNPNSFIEMLAVMGSVGTVAYTKKSDFDYWVCIDRQNLTKDEFSNFQRKVDDIQRWAMNEINIEIHLFINDIENIKNNIFAEDDDEAFGSTIGALLKDEFLRSSIIVAGKIPFWWVIPRFVNDIEYDKLYNQLSSEMKENEFIDLGNLRLIEKENFIGASLFQLIKSIGSPFKSIIKIGVLEKYLFSQGNYPLLSQQVKAAIISGKINSKILDSYLLMFEEVCNYYKENNKSRELLEVLQQNLYLKINPQLSKYIGVKNLQNIPYKVKIMFQYAKEWGWNKDYIENLDNFDNWNYQEVMIIWNMIRKYMLLSYQKIANEIPNLNLKDKISDTDFNLLSTKIKTFFRVTESKIDNYITFKDTPYEQILYIDLISKKDGQEWKLYKKIKINELHSEVTIKIDKDVIRLLAWASINQIYNPNYTRIQLQYGYGNLSQDKIVEFLKSISYLFDNKSKDLKNNYFLNKPFNLSNIIVIDFNSDKKDKLKNIYHIYCTSWGESFIERYDSLDGIIFILNKILSDSTNQNLPIKEYFTILSPDSHVEPYRSIEKIFYKSYEILVNSDTQNSVGFIASIGDKYITAIRNENKIILKSYQNYIQLLNALSLSAFKDIKYYFFGNDDKIIFLNSIYELKDDNGVIIVVEERSHFIFAYLINERGNLFTFIKPLNQKNDLISFLYNFSKNIISRINKQNYLPNINNIFVYEINYDRLGGIKFIDISEDTKTRSISRYKSKEAIIAIISKYKFDEISYSIKLLDNSSPEYSSLKNLPVQIINLIKKYENIIFFIQALKFNDLTVEDLKFGTTIYFIEKFKLETIVGKVLSKLNKTIL